MTQSLSATLCLFLDDSTQGDYRRCLESIIAHPASGQIELRLGIQQLTEQHYYTLGLLVPNATVADFHKLSPQVGRYRWKTSAGMTVRVWQTPAALHPERMARLLYHDVPLETEYMIRLDAGTPLEAGWWEPLQPLLEKKTDYIGTPAWQAYAPNQLTLIRASPWYMGMPFEKRDNQAGVSFRTGGFLAVRSQRLREANYPDPGLIRPGAFEFRDGDRDMLLGEVARQLGWTRAELAPVSNPRDTEKKQENS